MRGLYAIVDTLGAAEAVLFGGAKTIQLRAKSLSDGDLLDLALALRRATARFSTQLIINDRPDLAVLAEADGVHLGQDDLPLKSVRKWLPEGMLVGVSCHDPSQASRAIEDGADYIGFGPVYATKTKANPDPVVGPAGLSAIRRDHPDLVVVAIGGITMERVPEIKAAGASAFAMISALLTAPDVSAAAGEANRLWEGP